MGVSVTRGSEAPWPAVTPTVSMEGPNVIRQSNAPASSSPARPAVASPAAQPRAASSTEAFHGGAGGGPTEEEIKRGEADVARRDAEARSASERIRNAKFSPTRSTTTSGPTPATRAGVARAEQLRIDTHAQREARLVELDKEESELRKTDTASPQTQRRLRQANVEHRLAAIAEERATLRRMLSEPGVAERK